MSTIIKTLHLNEEEILTSGPYGSGKYANLNPKGDEPRVETVPGTAKKARDALHAHVKAATAESAKKRGLTDSQHDAIVHHAITQGRDNGYPNHKLHHKAPAGSPASSTTHASVEDYVKAHGSTVAGHAEHIIKNLDHYKKHFQKGQLHGYGGLRHTSEGTDINKDLNTTNVAKAVEHDCAKHVVHEQWGKGECIAGEHTLLDDGTVTHYDVMFEHGIEQNVSVADLTILVEMNHGHSRKKKSAMEEEAVTPEGGEDTSKASKKGKLEMPLEKLKAIMEKKKSKAYLAMLKSQGKMEEEAELDEKMLTKAEMKKREEVAKAIKRDDPGMPMGKKMAIATATAKKVAEELVGNQHRIDANKNGKVDAHDFKLLRAKKKTMKEFVEQLAESLSPKGE